MSVFKNVMVYLGLGPDEDYDDSYLYDDERSPRADEGADDGALDLRGQREPATAGMATGPGSATVGSVRPIRPVGDDEPGFTVRPIGGGRDDDDAEGTVRAVPLQGSKPRALAPQSFGDAKILADEFKRLVPVVINLNEVDRDLARRLIDFSSGVCYSLGGTMEKVAANVFLLTPRGVEVSADDRRRIEERGFDR